MNTKKKLSLYDSILYGLDEIVDHIDDRGHYNGEGIGALQYVDDWKELGHEYINLWNKETKAIRKELFAVLDKHEKAIRKTLAKLDKQYELEKQNKKA